MAYSTRTKLYCQCSLMFVVTKVTSVKSQFLMCVSMPMQAEHNINNIIMANLSVRLCHTLVLH